MQARPAHLRRSKMTLMRVCRPKNDGLRTSQLASEPLSLSLNLSLRPRFLVISRSGPMQPLLLDARTHTLGLQDLLSITFFTFITIVQHTVPIFRTTTTIATAAQHRNPTCRAGQPFGCSSSLPVRAAPCGSQRPRDQIRCKLRHRSLAHAAVATSCCLGERTYADTTFLPFCWTALTV